MSQIRSILALEDLSRHLAAEPPVAVATIDVKSPPGRLALAPSRDGSPYRQLLALLRDQDRPIGWVVLPVSSDNEVDLPPFLQGAELSAEPAPVPSRENPGKDALLSIVVATCAEAELVGACVEAILEGVAGDFEVIVVENRPIGSVVPATLERRFGGDPRVRYVEEHHPGLSSARNAGLAEARGGLVAFTDDDVRVDPGWSAALRSVFAGMPDVACVTGLILPLELETEAQLLDERFASFGKGFRRRSYSIDSPPADQPLFPYSAGYFGSGANMTFRTEAIRRLGGFDPALGTGTTARGCEDLDVCIRLLNEGLQLTYEPAAMIWHRHPETDEALRRQVFGYGVGMGAMLAKHAILGPRRWSVISRALQGLRYYTDPTSRKNAMRGPTFPRALVRLERVGLLLGPAAYLASRVKTPK